MYGFKEKNKYLNELRNSAAAEADLQLLQAAAPAHPKLKMFARNPQRYANDILYTLLDVKSKNDIRRNRREYELEKDGTPNPDDTHPEGGDTPGKDGTPGPDDTHPEGGDTLGKDGVPDPDDTHSESEDTPDSADLAQAEEHVAYLEQENQELKDELENEQGAREEAEERAEQVEQALELEKKKESIKVVPKSKSTKSTRKSPGKTLKTKTSK